jgi:GNAT superfamily N-acetyltransferase
MNVEIRPATAEDAPTLAQMRYAFRSSMGAAVEDEATFVARCTAWMAQRLGEDGPWRCWVAANDGAIAGHLWLQTIEKIPNPVVELENHAYITNVFVDAALRANGIGQRLMDAALAYCREQRVDSAILWPTPRSRTLYARNGFEVRDDLLEAVLDDGRDLSHEV